MQKPHLRRPRQGTRGKQPKQRARPGAAAEWRGLTPQTQVRRLRLAVAATAAIRVKRLHQMRRHHCSRRSLDSHDRTSSRSRLMAIQDSNALQCTTPRTHLTCRQTKPSPTAKTGKNVASAQAVESHDQVTRGSNAPTSMQMGSPGSSRMCQWSL